MENDEKEERRCAAGRDASGQLVGRCKVFLVYNVVHEAPDRRYGCVDCSFAIRARLNDKPRWV